MRLVRKPVLVLVIASALLPTLLIAFLLVPSYIPIGFSPGAVLIYPLLGGWLLCVLARAIFDRRFTPLERSVVGFWSRTLLFILVVATALGALPLLVVPALGQSFGWPLLNSALYIRSVTLAVLLFTGLLVWAVWRRHWASLLASSEAPDRSA
jgi:hypothetical protein